MSESAIIHEKLRKKEAEIQGLEEKLRTARIYVQALQDVLHAIGLATQESTADGMRSGSSVAQAREAILIAQKPIHIADLLNSLGKAVTKETRASLSSSLAAYVRRGEVFTRPAPNTFGLVELGHVETVVESDEPPPTFGKQSPSRTDDPDTEIPF